jgi:hypothetical protein
MILIWIVIVWIAAGLALVLGVNHQHPGEHGPRDMVALIVMWPVMIVQIIVERIRGEK